MGGLQLTPEIIAMLRAGMDPNDPYFQVPEGQYPAEESASPGIYTGPPPPPISGGGAVPAGPQKPSFGQRLQTAIPSMISGALDAATTPNIAGGGAVDILRAMQGVRQGAQNRDLMQYNQERQQRLDQQNADLHGAQMEQYRANAAHNRALAAAPAKQPLTQERMAQSLYAEWEKLPPGPEKDAMEQRIRGIVHSNVPTAQSVEIPPEFGEGVVVPDAQGKTRIPPSWGPSLIQRDAASKKKSTQESQIEARKNAYLAIGNDDATATRRANEDFLAPKPTQPTVPGLAATATTDPTKTPGQNAAAALDRLDKSKAAGRSTGQINEDLKPPDSASADILSQTGLSIPAFYALTGEITKVGRDSTTRQRAMKEARIFATKNGVDVSTLPSQYKTYNTVLGANIARLNNTKIMESELRGTVQNLQGVVNKKDLGILKVVNVVRILAGQEVNDSLAQQYAVHLSQLRNELSAYYAATQGRTGNNILEADMRDSANVIKNGLSSGSLEGLAAAVTNSTDKMRTVMQDSVDRARQQVWDLFGVGANYRSKSQSGVGPTIGGSEAQQPSAGDSPSRVRKYNPLTGKLE